MLISSFLVLNKMKNEKKQLYLLSSSANKFFHSFTVFRLMLTLLNVEISVNYLLIKNVNKSHKFKSFSIWVCLLFLIFKVFLYERHREPMSWAIKIRTQSSMSSKLIRFLRKACIRVHLLCFVVLFSAYAIRQIGLISLWHTFNIGRKTFKTFILVAWKSAVKSLY